MQIKKINLKTNSFKLFLMLGKVEIFYKIDQTRVCVIDIFLIYIRVIIP